MTSPIHDRAPTGLVSVGRVGRFRGLIRFFRDKEASLWGKAFALATFAYVIWPLDFLPDAVPFLGWLDDLGLASVATAYLFRVAGRYQDPAPPSAKDCKP